MSESERIDELAPIIAGIGRLAVGVPRAAGFAIKSFARKLAKKKAIEKAKEKLIGKNKNPQVDQAIEQEMEEACWKGYEKNESIHNAYFNFAVSLLEREEFGDPTMGALKTPGPKPKMTIDPATGNLVPKKPKTGSTTITPSADRPKPDAEAVEKNQSTETPLLRGRNRKEDEDKAKRRASSEVKARAQSIAAIRKERLAARRNKISARAKNIAAIRKQRQIDAKADARVKQIERERGTLKGAIKNKLRDVRDNAVTGALSARGIRQGFRNAGARFRAGRAASRSRRASMGPASGGFGEHAEYQRIGAILAEASAAWTRSEGKNPSGGLNAKGVASYRAQNPGSKLKTAVTTKPSKLKKGSKAAKRRKSFCARMKGMRKRQKSSNNTGKDRLSLSLKKWNC